MEDIFTLDDGLGASCQISHMEDCDVVIWRKICTTIISKEVIHLPFVLKLGSKVLSHDLGL